MKIKILIAGITPLLMNKYYDHTGENLSAEEEAENHAYRNSETKDLEIPYIWGLDY